jgi:5-formyltetrahydrofolate cyclo-ligase
MTPAEAKAAARKAALARRQAASGTDPGPAQERLLAALAPYSGKVLAGYMPMRGEIDPLPVMAANRGPVAVPVIDGKGLPLRFREWSPAALMIDGPFRALIPAEGAWLTPEVLIVPLLAFDRQGHRLGYGGGFYDRTLALLRAGGPITAIGFAFAAQEEKALPAEPTDARLDLIVTEAETIHPA